MAAQVSANKSALLEERCALLEDEAASGREWRRKAALGGEGRVANFPNGVVVGVGGDPYQNDPSRGLSRNQEGDGGGSRQARSQEASSLLADIHAKEEENHRLQRRQDTIAQEVRDVATVLHREVAEIKVNTSMETSGFERRLLDLEILLKQERNALDRVKKMELDHQSKRAYTQSQTDEVLDDLKVGLADAKQRVSIAEATLSKMETSMSTMATSVNHRVLETSRQMISELGEDVHRMARQSCEAFFREHKLVGGSGGVIAGGDGSVGMMSTAPSLHAADVSDFKDDILRRVVQAEESVIRVLGNKRETDQRLDQFINTEKISLSRQLSDYREVTSQNHQHLLEQIQTLEAEVQGSVQRQCGSLSERVSKLHEQLGSASKVQQDYSDKQVVEMEKRHEELEDVVRAAIHSRIAGDKKVQEQLETKFSEAMSEMKQLQATQRAVAMRCSTNIEELDLRLETKVGDCTTAMNVLHRNTQESINDLRDLVKSELKRMDSDVAEAKLQVETESAAAAGHRKVLQQSIESLERLQVKSTEQCVELNGRVMANAAAIQSNQGILSESEAATRKQLENTETDILDKIGQVSSTLTVAMTAQQSSMKDFVVESMASEREQRLNLAAELGKEMEQCKVGLIHARESIQTVTGIL
jgi:hypothetical protein